MENKKIVAILPNLFTALNLGCGFFSVILSIGGNYYFASILILLGLFFDLFDGRVARMLGVESRFGEQFDSLSDAITFALAPSVLFYLVYLVNFGRLGIVTAFLYLLCGALRLARFNANIAKVSSSYFQGLPSPAAAVGIVGLILFGLEYSLNFSGASIFVFLYITAYALLMISTFPFPSFKKSEWLEHNKMKVLFIISILILLAVTNEFVMILCIVNIYVLGSMAIFLMNKRNHKLNIIEELDDE
jgi:CDP-diacylglycerol--serine O-phosphatidyltransferase